MNPYRHISLAERNARRERALKVARLTELFLARGKTEAQAANCIAALLNYGGLDRALQLAERAV